MRPFDPRRALSASSSRSLLVALATLAFTACGGGTAGTGGAPGTTSTGTAGAGTGGTTGSTGTGGTTGSTVERPPAAEDLTRDIVATDLTLDVTTLAGTAVISLAPSASKAASFEIGDLDIASVEDGDGPLDFATTKTGQLDVGVPAGSAPPRITVKYTFKGHTDFDGWMPARGVSIVWPYFCGNLFPCHSSPADGLRFTLSVTGVPAGKEAIHPATIPADAPSYMPAVAVAAYTKIDLGKTANGTQINVWHLPGQAAAATAGSVNLRGVFEFYEKTYGPYTFGDTAGSVSVDWGPGGNAGMEHHPYWHIAKNDIDSEEVHAHEAAHGWFGNGVRIACWEDFVLSEGVTSYLAARALEEFSVDLWATYDCELQYVCTPANGANTVALPDTCNAIDLLHDPLWSTVPYMKGAYFLRDVAKAIGVDVLDQTLAAFYQANVGKAAHMQDLVDAIRASAGAQGAQIDKLADDWLKQVKCPFNTSSLCP